MFTSARLPGNNLGRQGRVEDVPNGYPTARSGSQSDIIMKQVESKGKIVFGVYSVY